MSTPLRETRQNETSVGALILAAIVGAMVVLTIFGQAAARAHDLQTREANEIHWTEPSADTVRQGEGTVDPTVVPAGGISR